MNVAVSILGFFGFLTFQYPKERKECERNMELKSPVSGVKLEYVKLKNGIRLRVASAGTSFCFFVRFLRCRRETNR